MKIKEIIFFMLVLSMLTGITGIAAAKADADGGGAANALTKRPAIQGIDVSHWQGDIDWNKVNKNGKKKFAFVKATEGINFIDLKSKKNMKNCKAAGMACGVYHFARPVKNTAKAEANYFISKNKNYLKKGYLRPALDVEDFVSKGYAEYPCKKLGKKKLSKWVKEWMDTVKKGTGVEPILYINSNYARNCFDSSVTNRDLWIAYWASKPSPNTGIWKGWDFWQYSSKGSVPGIKGNVDLDRFNGDMSGLKKNFIIK